MQQCAEMPKILMLLQCSRFRCQTFYQVPWHQDRISVSAAIEAWFLLLYYSGRWPLGWKPRFQQMRVTASWPGVATSPVIYNRVSKRNSV